MARLLALSIVLLCAACNTDPEPPPDATPPASVTTPDRGAPTESTTEARYDAASVDLALEDFLDGLESPLLLTHADDGSGRLFVVEQVGRIRLVENGALSDDPYLDISERVEAGGEQGLLGLAFHPNFERNGRFFVDYTDTSGDTVVSEFSAVPNADTADVGERVLLRIEQPYPNHNGGHLAFGPDGYLYVASGDGGSGGDPHNNGQRVDTLLGKLLRIDVDAGEPYGIPPDNPFADGGGREEIWAYGLRNPWRFSFDDGRIWIADVGQEALEEVNRRRDDEAGVNYGWNVMEGTECSSGAGCDRSGLVEPVTEYSHDHGCSITGGYVYRGDDFPDMRGGYFFGDYCSGTIWSIPADAQQRLDPIEMLSSETSISSFGLDADGELYAVDLGGGRVLKVVDRS